MLTISRGFVWTVLAAILLLAAFLRFWQLDTLPPGLYHDEAYNGLDALSLLEGKIFPQFYEGWERYAADAHAQRPALETRFPVFFEGNYGREPLHIYLMALSISLLGAQPAAVRAVPAAAGVLAVLTTFLAAKALLGPLRGNGSANALALMAAFFLAVLYPAVHFSRFGIRAMLFIPFETLAVASFWSAVNRSGKQDSENDRGVWILFLVAGIFLGLGIYTFAAARLLPLVWLIFIPLWFWKDRQVMHDSWRQVVVMAGAAFVTALPLLYFFARYPYYFVFRIAYVANKGKGAVEGRPLQTWLLNLGRVGRGLIWQGETHLRHNLPGRPYLDPIQAGFFLIGLARSLRRLMVPRYLFLIIWFGVMLLPSILSGDAPHFGRLVGIAAPAAVLCALGVEWLAGQLESLLSAGMEAQRAKLLTAAALALLLILSASLTFRDYFGRYANHPDLARDFYLDDWQLGQYAASLPEDTRLFLTPGQEELATIYFALTDPDRLRNYDGSAGLLPAGTPGRDSIYLLRSGEQETAGLIRRYFPQSRRESVAAGLDAFHVPASAERVQAQNRIETNFAGKISLAGYSYELQGDNLLVTLFWFANEDMDRDYTSFLHLTGPDGEIAAQIDQPPPGYPTSDWVPGEVVVARFEIPWPDGLEITRAGLRTGFYYLPDLEPLGRPAVLAASGEIVP